MQIDPDRLNELLFKIVGDMGAAMSAALVSLGDRLGLYRHLAESGKATSKDLAGRAKVDERMTREWLLNQAASGYVSYDEAGDCYFLTPEQRAAFADDSGPASMLGAFDIIESMHKDVGKVGEAFKSGGGLPWGGHDTCLFCGTERFFASGYRANLVGSWIPALGGVEQRLRDGAEAADVGCGHGASTVLMAAAFPKSRFVGYDFHEPSINCARERAKAAGIGNVRFEVADATSFPSPGGGFDLVACFDCVHDMADPVGCARHVKKSLRKGGTWMVVEPAAGDTVASNLNPVGRVFSAASTMICVPASQAGGGPALGACAGAKRIHDVMRRGGFEIPRIATTTPFNHIHAAEA
ncbi:MAG: methyltransferase domain-containing protein [Phycisphaerales bacterium]|nr:methyltransferase domain-containing protein [Phycisphaerales bacterium]